MSTARSSNNIRKNPLQTGVDVVKSVTTEEEIVIEIELEAEVLREDHLEIDHRSLHRRNLDEVNPKVVLVHLEVKL